MVKLLVKLLVKLVIVLMKKCTTRAVTEQIAVATALARREHDVQMQTATTLTYTFSLKRLIKKSQAEVVTCTTKNMAALQRKAGMPMPGKTGIYCLPAGTEISGPGQPFHPWRK